MEGGTCTSGLDVLFRTCTNLLCIILVITHMPADKLDQCQLALAHQLLIPYPETPLLMHAEQAGNYWWELRWPRALALLRLHDLELSSSVSDSVSGSLIKNKSQPQALHLCHINTMIITIILNNDS